MSDHDDESAYGTLARDAPVTRADFERAVRSLNMSDLDLRDALLKLAARVVTLTDELTRRLDGVQPLPAEPNTPAPPPTGTIEAAVDGALAETLAIIRANDVALATRVSLDLGRSKYEQPSPDVPCAELIPLCQARCCTLSFALSTQDLDEGVIRWDYGQPYLIRQRASDGYCVHNDPDTRGCTVHGFRPRVCRGYDCREDKRIWTDFANRVVAPVPEGVYNDRGRGSTFDLMERARARSAAVLKETLSISQSYADTEPRKGPRP
ncbi:MAG TPA: YkgJ family cysteine cluster protein [Kofleriaceae bacterium]|nr:YkgJ family cysteine cluster protein [Kofleriaceae bacterium]